MKRILKKIALKRLILSLILFSSLNYASVEIILQDDIRFSNKEGVVNALINHNGNMINAYGNYKVNGNKKVLFSIDRLSKDGRPYTLKAKPSVIRELKSINTIMPKGSKLLLKGENPKEFNEFLNYANSGQGNTQGGSKNSNSSSNKNLGSNYVNSGQGGSQGSSVENISPSTSSQVPYLPITTPSSGDSSTGDSNTQTTWSAQYCKAPEFMSNNIKLSIVDKDGNCVEKLAVRDDTKCKYRYDFVNSKAIKQTQFYYVDNENKTQNIGDCIDLVGAEYETPLYKDDTRCSLEKTDKDYGGGKGTFFVTQILFRGLDGLIYEATDCIAYGNIKEEVVDYIKDDQARQGQRIVNQYYIDPYTNEQVYITKGVRTDITFPYAEKSCGDWEMDDENLRGKKRTEISFYDEMEYKEVPVTSCDFSTQGGKKSEYVVNYQNLSSTYKEKELSRKYETHQIGEIKTQYQQYEWRTCKTCAFFAKCCDGTNRSHWVVTYNGGITNWTTAYVTKDVTAYNVYLRPDGTEYKKNLNPNGKIFTRIDREVTVTQNDYNLEMNWLLYYEIKENFYQDNTISTSTNYNSWVNNTYKKNYGCQTWNIVNNSTSGTATCTKRLNYILTK
ncbi:MAG: hypothetical protein MSA68_00105 [Helicobacter sp.]|nr:hypothetical protein [Helicobacter sp.]